MRKIIVDSMNVGISGNDGLKAFPNTTRVLMSLNPWYFLTAIKLIVVMDAIAALKHLLYSGLSLIYFQAS
jgi:hypothetical protein